MITIKLHRTLLRQINKFFGDVKKIPADFSNLFKTISDTYANFDEDRRLVERSLELSSDELSEYISLLKSTLEATRDGTLVVDKEGKTVIYNQQFTTMWKIPEEILMTHDDKKLLGFVSDQLKNPKVFLKKVKELYNKPEADSFDFIEFIDGRVFERYSKPQRVGEKIIGRVWNFRDITEQKKAEENKNLQTQALEKMNKLMVG
jgi:PAS domain-containing protein